MFIKLLISFLIGAVIGLEREAPQPAKEGTEREYEAHEVGLRSFSLISLLGCLAGIMISDYFPIFILISALIGAVIISYYILHSTIDRDPGITTEIALIYSYLIGLMIGREVLPMQLIIAIGVVLILILSRKQDIKDFVVRLRQRELHAFIGYAVIALVVLPFLPDQGYSLGDIPYAQEVVKRFDFPTEKLLDAEIFNPFKLWFIVALITGIDIVGYVLERVLGAGRGRLVSSLAGGFISSTATTQALAQESNRTKNHDLMAAAAIFANMVSFIPIFFLIGSTNGNYLARSAPTLFILLVSAAAVGTFFYLRSRGEAAKKVKQEEPQKHRDIFDLKSALRFVVIFGAVRIISEIALALFGSQGLLVASAVAALTGIDAAILTVSQLAGRGVDYSTAVWALILINAVNLIAKTVYSFLQGSRAFAIRFLVAMLIIIAFSMIGPFFNFGG